MFHMWMHAVGGFPSATYFRATLFPLNNHCVKSVQIKSFSGPYFLVFRLNTQIYSAKYGPEKLRIGTIYTLLLTLRTKFHVRSNQMKSAMLLPY